MVAIEGLAVAIKELAVAVKESGIKIGAEALGYKIPASVIVSTNETDETKKDSGP